MKAKEKYYAVLVKTVKAMLLVAFVVGIAIVLPLLSSGKSKTEPGSSKKMTAKAVEVSFSEKSQAVAESAREFGYPAPVDTAQDINPAAELPLVKDNNADTKDITTPLRIVRLPERTTETEAGRDAELLPKQPAKETEITTPLRIPPLFTDELIAKLPVRPNLEPAAEFPVIKDAAELNVKDEKDNTSLRNTTIRRNITTGPSVIRDSRNFEELIESVKKTENIHQAIARGHLDRAKELLRENPELVNARRPYGGETPLSIAIGSQNDPMIVRFLIANGADINVRDRRGHTPLGTAAARGRNSMAELLIANGADVNVKSDYGETPLRSAVDSDNKALAELLIANGADVNAKDDYGDSPLGAAVFANSGARPEFSIAQLLIDNGADVNTRNGYGNTPLDVAVSFNSVPMAELLIVNGADVDAKDVNGFTPLHCAVNSSNESMAEFLIANGADVNIRDDYNNILLHSAVAKGNEAEVNFLITNGADINAINDGELTPLGLAVMLYPDESMAELLIVNGADVNVSDEHGWTLLHRVARYGNETVLGFLINEGLDVNAEDKNGCTPLHDAVVRGDKAIVEILLANSANVNVPDNYGQTPLSIAMNRIEITTEKEEYNEIAELLRTYGAKE